MNEIERLSGELYDRIRGGFDLRYLGLRHQWMDSVGWFLGILFSDWLDGQAKRLKRSAKQWWSRRILTIRFGRIPVPSPV